MYRALFRQQILRRLRQPRPRLFWLAAVLVGLLLLYLVVGLIATGLAAEVLVFQLWPGTDPVSFVNSRLPEWTLGLLVLRFFFQKVPEGSITPYLHLPVRRRTLARFFTLYSACSLHNVLPLFFAVPFAIRTVATIGGVWGALLWLGGFTALLAAADLLNTLARMAAGTHPRRFAATLLVCAGLVAFDLTLGPGWLRLGGWLLFNTLASGHAAALFVCWAAVVLLWIACTALFTRRLHLLGQTPLGLHRALVFEPSRPLRNLIQLEVALIQRNARPRQFVFMSVLFSTAYLCFFLWQESGAVASLLLGYMATGMFALNYGPLMFGWESTFFDGLLARPLSLDRLVRSKLLLLQLSCILLGLAALPVFAWLAPGFTAHLGVTALYNAGVSAPVVLWLALSNRTRLDLGRASVFNFQGVSVHHMAWTLGLSLPPVALVLLWDGAGLAVLAALGAAGAAATLAWPLPFTNRLSKSRHLMAAAFRSSVA